MELLFLLGFRFKKQYWELNLNWYLAASLMQLLKLNQNAYKNKKRCGLSHIYPKQRLPEPITRIGSDYTGSFKFQEVKFCDTKCDLLMDFQVKQNRPVIQKEDKRHSIHSTLCLPLVQRLSVFYNQTLDIHPCFLPAYGHVVKGKYSFTLSPSIKKPHKNLSEITGPKIRLGESWNDWYDSGFQIHLLKMITGNEGKGKPLTLNNKHKLI